MVAMDDTGAEVIKVTTAGEPRVTKRQLVTVVRWSRHRGISTAGVGAFRADVIAPVPATRGSGEGRRWSRRVPHERPGDDRSRCRVRPRTGMSSNWCRKRLRSAAAFVALAGRWTARTRSRGDEVSVPSVGMGRRHRPVPVPPGLSGPGNQGRPGALLHPSMFRTRGAVMSLRRASMPRDGPGPGRAQFGASGFSGLEVYRCSGGGSRWTRR